MKLTQCVKIQVSRPVDHEWAEVRPILWDLQRNCAKVLNYCIRAYYLHDYEKEEWKIAQGRYPTREEMPDLYLYPELVTRFPGIPTATVGLLDRAARMKWNMHKNDVLYFQKVSLPSFRQDHPILFRNRTLALRKVDGVYIFMAQLRPRYHTDAVKRCDFVLNTKSLCKGHRAVLDRVISGEYKLGAPRFHEKGGKCFITLPYHFNSVDLPDNAPEVRIGVDLGVAFPAVCAIHGSHERLFLQEEGATITSFFNQIYRRRRNILRNGREVLGRRSGHGLKNKLKPIERFRDKVENFRETSNHRISHAVVEWAQKQGATVIVLEDLAGIGEKSTFLKRWPYFDLRQKITYKAAGHGIRVESVNPHNTSRRCSECGHTDETNRPNRDIFRCVQCGYQAHADYNAARNLAAPR